MGDENKSQTMVDRLSDQIYAGKKEREKMEIIANEKIEHADASKILVYGASGTGKTTLVKTLVPLGKVLLLSAEAGLLSIRGVAGIDVVRIEKPSDLSDAYTFLLKEKHSYSWVALDSLTEIAEMIVESAKEDDEYKKNSWHPYNRVLEGIIKLVKAFRRLPISFYFSAKEEIGKTDSGAMASMLSMPGNKLGNALPYYFDEIFKLYVAKVDGERKRFLLTDNDGTSVAKDRSGKLADVEPADLAAIVGKMKS